MMPYRPKALRLVSCALDPRAPAPPFELASWSADATSIAVLVDASGLEPGDPEAVAAQIPRATALAAASRVYILEDAARHRGVMGWIERTTKISRATRCTALVARGYACVAAGIDDASGYDLAWGISSPC
jgi:hypothetical protein